jgi:hypothetical protein
MYHDPTVPPWDPRPQKESLPPTPAGGGWYGPPQEPPYGWQQPKSNRTPLVVGLVIAVLIAIAVIAALAYFGSQLGGLVGRTGLQDVSVGQCFNGARPQPGSSADVFFSVEIVECTVPHTSELAASLNYPGGASGIAYPGAESLLTFAEVECPDGFADYVGVSFQESILDMTVIYPLESNWALGDYSIQCVIHPEKGQETASQSFRNSRL